MIQPIERDERIRLRSEYLLDDIFIILYNALLEVCKNHKPLCPEMVWREAESFSSIIRTIRRPEWELQDHIDLLHEKCDDDFIAKLVMICTLYKLTPESKVNQAVGDTLVYLLQTLKCDILYKKIRVLVYKYEKEEELRGHVIDIHTYLLREEERKATNKHEAIENQRMLMEVWANQAVKNNDNVLNAQIVVMSAVNQDFDYQFTEYVDRLREEMAMRVEAKKQPAVQEQYMLESGSCLIKDSSFTNTTIAAGMPQHGKQLPMN